MSVLFKIDKETGKELKKLADQLPDVSPKHMTGEQILEKAKAEGTINEERFKKINPKEKYIVSGIGVKCAVNHEKRLRSAFMNGNWQAVQNYLDQYIEKPKQNEGESTTTESAK